MGFFSKLSTLFGTARRLGASVKHAIVFAGRAEKKASSQQRAAVYSTRWIEHRARTLDISRKNADALGQFKAGMFAVIKNSPDQNGTLQELETSIMIAAEKLMAQTGESMDDATRKCSQPAWDHWIQHTNLKAPPYLVNAGHYKYHNWHFTPTMAIPKKTEIVQNLLKTALKEPGSPPEILDRLLTWWKDATNMNEHEYVMRQLGYLPGEETGPLVLPHSTKKAILLIRGVDAMLWPNQRDKVIDTICSNMSPEMRHETLKMVTRPRKNDELHDDELPSHDACTKITDHLLGYGVKPVQPTGTLEGGSAYATTGAEAGRGSVS